MYHHHHCFNVWVSMVVVCMCVCMFRVMPCFTGLIYSSGSHSPYVLSVLPLLVCRVSIHSIIFNLRQRNPTHTHFFFIILLDYYSLNGVFIFPVLVPPKPKSSPPPIHAFMLQFKENCHVHFRISSFGSLHHRNGQ